MFMIKIVAQEVFLFRQLELKSDAQKQKIRH